MGEGRLQCSPRAGVASGGGEVTMFPKGMGKGSLHEKISPKSINFINMNLNQLCSKYKYFFHFLKS